MVVVCAWCATRVGEKEPLDDGSETHTICEGCYGIMTGKSEPAENFTGIFPADDVRYGGRRVAAANSGRV